MITYEQYDKKTTWYKFYMVELTNNRFKKPDDGKRIIKFGITRHKDALDRFNVMVDDGYKKNYKDWDIRVLFSIMGPKDRIENLEKHMLNVKFPARNHKVWIEKYLLDVPDNKYYSDNSGVTEIRVLKRDTVRQTIQQLLKMKDKFHKEVGYKK